MQDDLKQILELAENCLKNFKEPHYYRAPKEDVTIDNLKNIVIIVNEYKNSKEERERKHIEAMRHWFGPHYKRDNAEWLAEKKDDGLSTDTK